MIPVPARWVVRDVPDQTRVRDLTAALHVPPALATLLLQRGHDTPEDAAAFLRPSLDALSDPFQLPDMARAVELLAEAVGRGQGPKDVLVSLGYAGWSAGQLEHEIAQNAWLTVAADPDVLFETPADARLPAAMRLLGIDFSRLSDAVGHA